MKNIRIVILAILVMAGASFIPYFIKSSTTVPSTGSQEAVASTGSSVDVIGQYQGKELKVSDLTSEEKVKLYEAEKQRYSAFEEILLQRYMHVFFEDYKAKKKLASVQEAQDSYFKSNIKVKDSDVKEFLEKNKDNAGLQKIEQSQRSARVREYLENQEKSQVMQKWIREAQDAGKVQVAMVKPVEPRLQVGDGQGHVWGPEKAPVTIVEFADYQCPFCARVVPTLKEVVKKYSGKVRWVYRDFPLVQIHPEALPAAVAATCAGKQGKYFPMHDVLFENHQKLSQELYLEQAKKLKLNTEQFSACLKDSKVQAAIMQDMEEGTKVGVNGTPAYFVNGRKIAGGADLGEFSRYIDEELKR